MRTRSARPRHPDGTVLRGDPGPDRSPRRDCPACSDRPVERSPSPALHPCWEPSADAASKKRSPDGGSARAPRTQRLVGARCRAPLHGARRVAATRSPGRECSVSSTTQVRSRRACPGVSRRPRRRGRTTLARGTLAGTSLARRAAMNLRYALLALLADGEAHGYELLKRFNERIGPFWHPNIGQVYQLLHELERRGLAVRRDVAVGTRVRHVFRMTARGERALGTWLARRPGWPAPLRDEIIVRLLAA